MKFNVMSCKTDLSITFFKDQFAALVSQRWRKIHRFWILKMKNKNCLWETSGNCVDWKKENYSQKNLISEQQPRKFYNFNF